MTDGADLENHLDWREGMSSSIAVLAKNQELLDARLEAVEISLEKNTKLTQEVADDTKDLRAFFAEARGAFRLFNRIIKVFQWVIKFVLVPLAGLFVSFLAFKTGAVPAWFKALVELAK